MLLTTFRHHFPGPRVERPAEVLDDILTELLDFDLVELELPRGQLALCDFEQRRVTVTTQMAQTVRPNTNLLALANSTKAHELGHIRLHEEELFGASDGQSGLLFPELAPSTRLVTYRDEERKDLSAEERRREWEADLYAAIFLVPEPTLFERYQMRRIQAALEEGRELSSRYLWSLTYELARWFVVSPTMMKNHLVGLGFLEYRPNSRELALSSQLRLC